MLNVVNLITAFKEKLVEQREKILAVIEPYIDAIVDHELDLDIEWQTGGFETEISAEKYTAYITLFDTLVSKSFQLPDGVVFGVVKETITDATHTIYVYKDGMHNNEEICRLISAVEGPYNSYFVGWNGWDVSHRSTLGDNLKALYDGLLDAEAISTAAMTAIDLCCKGQLDPTNFSATLANMGLTSRDAVKEAVNIILGNVSGKDAFEQAKGLVLAFQQLYSGAMPGNITVDEDRINFHPLEYSVSSAIMLPIDGIVSSVAGMVGIIIGAFGNPLGFVLAAAGSAASGLLNIAETTMGNDWNISPLATLDNEACCLPVVSGTFDAKDLPSKLVQYTEKYGYLRSENSLYTIYSWTESVKDQDHDYDRINIEMFFNVNVDINKKYWNQDVPTDNSIIDYLKTSTSQSGNTWSFSATTKYGCKDIVDDAFEQVDSLTNTTKVQYPTDSLQVFPDWQNRYLTYNMILQYAFFISRLFAVSSDYSNFELGSYGSNLNWWNFVPSPVEVEHMDMNDCRNYIGRFLAWVSYSLRNGDLDHWSDIPLPSIIDTPDWTACTAAIVNLLYTGCLVVRKLMNNDANLIKDIFTIFPTVIDMGDVITDGGDAILGKTAAWSCSPCITYETQFLVAPPKNRYNFTTRLVMTTLVVVAIATVTAITTSQIKRRIAWKTMEKQKQLTKLRDKYQKTGTFEDFNNLYRAAKKYDRTYGFLTGTSFDMANAWVNDRTSAGVFTSTSDVFPALVKADPTTGQAAFDLNPVIKLIKPVD